jgi:hypothetical protein
MATPRTGRPVGRPKLFDYQHTVKFTAEQVEAIKAARRPGMSFADAVRVLVNRGMEGAQ